MNVATDLGSAQQNPPPVEISLAEEVSDEVIEAMARLIPQLSFGPDPTVPSRAHLERIIASDNSKLLLARSSGRIVGTLTLVATIIPTSSKGRIEDVVVDQAARGQGIARSLCRAALEIARNWGIKTVSLTSRPERQAANKLYQSLGFQRFETNVYRLRLDSWRAKPHPPSTWF